MVLHLKLYHFLLFINFPSHLWGFLTTKTAHDSSTTLTHSDITTTGITKAVSKFLLDNGYVLSSSKNVIDDFFGSDNDQKKKFYEAISLVITASNTLQRSKFGEAKYSVNGEQIEDAHQFVIQTKNEMKAISRQTLTPDLISIILEKIGKCLFVIQSFYSNTNWVEKFGNISYPDFGVEGVTLIPTAPPNTPTCRNCNDPYSSMSINPCSSNLINNNFLTSGYRSGQDIYKVQLQGYTEGKCSHGDPKDSSRFIPATGGINKETPDVSYSPHGYLHQQAAEAAIAATVDFLTDKSRGILSFMDKDKFQTLFHLRRRKSNVSLAFSVDVSGSMSDDIAAVSKTIIAMITSTMGSPNEPADYVLAIFNDPESLTNGWKSANGNDIETRVKGLSASGGGDCPEYSFSGILKAIELSLNGSTVKHFTDADAKDCHRMNEVMRAANSKRIKLDFLLTGNCSGFTCSTRVKRMGMPMARSSMSLYDQLALGTGGQVTHTTKQNISNVLHDQIKHDFPSSQTVIETFKVAVSPGKDVYVYADADMDSMRIEVTGPLSDSEVILKDPLGASVTVGGKVTRFFTSPKVILAVKHPVSGKWTLQGTASRQWQVNVTAEARMYATFHFKEPDENGFPYEFKGNPISGANYTLEVLVSNLPGDPTAAEILLVSKERATISNYTATLSFEATGKVSRLLMTVPNREFSIQLVCHYTNRSLSSRRSSNIFTPVSAKLTLPHINDEVVINVPHKLPYLITNAGASDMDYTVKYVDDKGYFSSVQNTHDHTLTAGERKLGAFYITGRHNAEVVKYTISLFEKGSSEVLQSADDTVVFTSTLRPQCNVNIITGNCSILNDTVDRTKYTWNASVTITFSGTNLTKIYLGNADSNVKIKYAPLAGASSPLRMDISGTCRTPSVVIKLRDSSGSVNSCLVRVGEPFSGYQQVTKESINKDDDTNLDTGAIVGIVIGSLAGITVLSIIMIVVSHLKLKAAPVEKKSND